MTCQDWTYSITSLNERRLTETRLTPRLKHNYFDVSVEHTQTSCRMTSRRQTQLQTLDFNFSVLAVKTVFPRCLDTLVPAQSPTRSVCAAWTDVLLQQLSRTNFPSADWAEPESVIHVCLWAPQQTQPDMFGLFKIILRDSFNLEFP